MLYEDVLISLSSTPLFFKKSVNDFDFWEFASWAALEVTPSVTIAKLTVAISGLVMTFPSPLKETVFEVVAVFKR